MSRIRPDKNLRLVRWQVRRTPSSIFRLNNSASIRDIDRYTTRFGRTTTVSYCLSLKLVPLESLRVMMGRSTICTTRTCIPRGRTVYIAQNRSEKGIKSWNTHLAVDWSTTFESLMENSARYYNLGYFLHTLEHDLIAFRHIITHLILRPSSEIACCCAITFPSKQITGLWTEFHK